MGLNTKFVIIETAFNQNSTEQKKYAKKCLKDAYDLGEIAFCPSLFYSSFKNLNRTEINNFGREWRARIKNVVLYTDLGYTHNMLEAINEPKNKGDSIESRSLFNHN